MTAELWITTRHWCKFDKGLATLIQSCVSKKITVKFQQLQLAASMKSYTDSIASHSSIFSTPNNNNFKIHIKIVVVFCITCGINKKTQQYKYFNSMPRVLTGHVLTYSGFNFLSPPLTATFSSLSMLCMISSSSLSLSSSCIISMSRTGSTLPSTCVISSSSNAPKTKEHLNYLLR